LVGKAEEGKAIEFYDKNFDMQLAYFANEAVFKQKVKLLTKSSVKISGTVEFMVCDDEKCLPPEVVDFSVDIKGETSDVAKPENVKPESLLVKIPVDTMVVAQHLAPDS